MTITNKNKQSRQEISKADEQNFFSNEIIDIV